MNAVCIQLDIVWADPRANCSKVAEMLTETELAPGDLVVLPEMFSTGFSMEPAALAEPLDGPTAAFLSETAQQFGVYMLSGMALKCDNSFANEAVLTSPDGSIIGQYRKVHPFSPSGEGMHYASGDETVVLPVGPFNLAPAVCYDLRFPKLFRNATGKGANLIVVIANWPAKRADHWACLLQARAIENQAYVVGVNRCGSDPNHDYSGQSAIIDPQGVTLARAGAEQCAIRAPLDPNEVTRWRSDFPALDDIRSDLT